MKKLIIALLFAPVLTNASTTDPTDEETTLINARALSFIAVSTMEGQIMELGANNPALKSLDVVERNRLVHQSVAQFTAGIDKNLASGLAQGKNCESMWAALQKENSEYIKMHPEKTAFILASNQYFKNKCAILAHEMP